MWQAVCLCIFLWGNKQKRSNSSEWMNSHQQSQIMLNIHAGRYSLLYEEYVEILKMFAMPDTLKSTLDLGPKTYLKILECDEMCQNRRNRSGRFCCVALYLKWTPGRVAQGWLPQPTQ